MLLRRLRAWSPSSWVIGSRAADTRATLQVLADMAARAAAAPIRTVPDVGVHGLADQLVVLAEDARRAGTPTAQVDGVLDDLAVRLGLA